MCRAKVISNRMVASDIHPGQMKTAYRVKYDVDECEQEFEEEELRPLLVVENHPQRKEILNGLIPAFDYLESRVIGTCTTSSYSCKHMYEVCRLVRVFDPNVAIQVLSSSSYVDDLVSCVNPLMEHVSADNLKREIPTYMARAQLVSFADNDVDEYCFNVLKFWKTNAVPELAEWCKAARIVFSMSPNSASCERVFSMLKVMYGERSDSVLADHMQAALMMRFNKRVVEW